MSGAAQCCGCSLLLLVLLLTCSWYSVNYSLADDFVWGQGAGCRFAEGSCGEWIATQQAKYLAIVIIVI